MKKNNLMALILVLFVGSIVHAQSVLPDKINRNAICTTGNTFSNVPVQDRNPAQMFPSTYVVETDSNGRLDVQSSLTRAVLSGSSQQKVKLNFTYLGPIEDSLNNENGHRQIGIKLKAANSCNVVYAIWDIGNRIIEVSIKRNDGKVGSCKDKNGNPTGYTMLTPNTPLPDVVPGSDHSLQAEYVNGNLKVWADQTLVWSGAIGSMIPFNGPVGFRTDGGAYKVDFFTKLSSPLTAANLNVPYVIGENVYPCFPAKPSIQFSKDSYVLQSNKAIASIVPASTAGAITDCSGAAPQGLAIDRTTCAISGTPTGLPSSKSFNVTAYNSRGAYIKPLTIGIVINPPSAPIIQAPTPGYESVAVNFQGSTDDGGSPITKYYVSIYSATGSYLSGFSTSRQISPIVVSNLVGGVTYQFKMMAENAYGLRSPYSGIVSATAKALSKPNAPTMLPPVAKVKSVAVNFQGSTDDGGSPITKYYVSVYSATGSYLGAFSTSGQSSPITVSNLVGGVTYQFKVMAENKIGLSPYSTIVSATPLK